MRLCLSISRVFKSSLWQRTTIASVVDVVTTDETIGTVTPRFVMNPFESYVTQTYNLENKVGFFETADNNILLLLL